MNKKITHLDYGGGDGKFSTYLNTKKKITSSFFDPYYNNILSVDFKKDEYNIITLWHVLEHVYDLDVLFKNIGKSLK